MRKEKAFKGAHAESKSAQRNACVRNNGFGESMRAGTIITKVGDIEMLGRGLVLCCLLFVCACETELGAAYDDFRDQVPPVCKDYCEEKVACERVNGIGGLDDEMFTSQVHFCEIECAAYAIEGAYVWSQDSTGMAERYYEWHLDGNSVIEAFDCLYDMGAYRCVTSGTAYVQQFTPPARNVCDAANDCVNGFNIDHAYYWAESPDGLGGSCNKRGTDFIESIFF